MTALSGDRVQILITGAAVSITDEALLDSGDHTTFTVTSGNTAHRYWDDTAVFVFQTSPDGATWTTVAPSSVQYVGGKVTFPGAVGGTHQARVHAGYYLPFSAMADAMKADASASTSFGDSTSFTTTSSPTAWRTFKPLLSQAVLHVTKWHVDNTFLLAITNKTKYVVSFLPDVTGSNRIEGFARVRTDAISAAVNALTSEPLEFTVTGNLYPV